MCQTLRDDGPPHQLGQRTGQPRHTSHHATTSHGLGRGMRRTSPPRLKVCQTQGTFEPDRPGTSLNPKASSGCQSCCSGICRSSANNSPVCGLSCGVRLFAIRRRICNRIAIFSASCALAVRHGQLQGRCHYILFCMQRYTSKQRISSTHC